MTRIAVFILLSFQVISFRLYAQAAKQSLNLSASIDSILKTKTAQPFSGVILFSRNGKTQYSKTVGFSDSEKKQPLNLDDPFVIGSISKQITAVLVLQAYEKGLLRLHTPIRQYLPELTEPWADSVTVHHLLTHTHGITELAKPLAFQPGTQFAYSQIGFDLLAKVVEKTTHQSFAELSSQLFKRCGMKSSFHPDLLQHKRLVKGYTQQEDGKLGFESQSLKNFVAAGAFISTARDLVLWDQHLFGRKLLADSTYALMTTKQRNAIRQHPIFGTTTYGYGITITNENTPLQLGQTGFAPGFVSMNYYYPATKTSLVVLSNVAWDTDNLKNTFYYLVEILKVVQKGG